MKKWVWSFKLKEIFYRDKKKEVYKSVLHNLERKGINKNSSYLTWIKKDTESWILIKILNFKAKYPQMKKLFGHDWRISIQFTFTVFVQIFMAYMVRNSSWLELFILTYVVSGTLNHSLSVGLHEISHNLAFGSHRPVANRILGFFSNLPMAVPVFFLIHLLKYFTIEIEKM